MKLLPTLGYRFKVPGTDEVKESLILASAMPSHELERRKFKKHGHLQRVWFDPQLYLSTLESGDRCTKLASYPWFQVEGLTEFDSGEQKQSDWRAMAERKMPRLWPGSAPEGDEAIAASVESCIKFQESLGVEGVILPTPLTADPASDYSIELSWLDAGIQAAIARSVERPLFATVAVSDVCVRYLDPPANPLLDTILDSVGAREVDGVYIVLEQSSEGAETRHISSKRALWSLLEMVGTLRHDCGFRVGVNFAGAFGLACLAAGAEFWSTGWYKSLYRLRLGDVVGGGPAYPTFWSKPLVADIHLESEFDAMVRAGLLDRVRDETAASESLLRAAEQRKPAARVPAWRYRASNVGAAMEHYMLSCIRATHDLSKISAGRRLSDMDDWLRAADELAADLSAMPQYESRTSINHIHSWLEAVRAYRRSQRA